MGRERQAVHHSDLKFERSAAHRHRSLIQGACARIRRAPCVVQCSIALHEVSTAATVRSPGRSLAQLGPGDLQRIPIHLAGADAHHFLQIPHEDLAVADLAGASGFHDRFDHSLDLFIDHRDFEFDLR
jgi:hypothetical protein